MTKSFLLMVCLLTVALPSAVFAEEGFVVGSEDRNVVPGVRRDVHDIRKDIREDIKDERWDSRGDVRDIRKEAQKDLRDARRESEKDIRSTRATTTEAIKKNRQEMTIKIRMATTTEDRRELRIELRKDFQEDRTQKREELKIVIREKKNILKEKLKLIKDERKTKVVERIDDRIDSVNELRTNSLIKILQKFEDFLDRISAQADNLEKEGKNVASVRTAVTSAESAIAASRAAVEAQAGKVYTITITTEGDLRNNVGAVVVAMQSDLKNVRETVKLAHEAVRKALSALKLIIGASFSGSSSAATSTNGE